jgi:c-di-GMP-binding flagellar brake protein YcgR
MSSDTQPADLDALGGPDGAAEFRVSDAVEIRALLKSLMDSGTLVNLSASDGSAYTTTVWMLDTDHRKISFTADMRSPAVERLVEAEDAVAVAYLDQVKVQFELQDRMLVHGHQACVMQASLPRVLYRFQRRNAYRVRTLERSAPTARFRHPEMPDVMLELRLVDVSVGGCALFMPSDLPPLQPGSSINGCRVQLDAETDFQTTLVVHHITAIQPEKKGVRLGCELLKLSSDAQRSLQRYIDQTQKRRRLLSLD